MLRGAFLMMFLLVAPALARAEPATLFVLSRDGQLARVAGERTEIVRRLAGASRIAGVPGGVAVLAGERVQAFDGTSWRPLPHARIQELFPAAPPHAAKLVPGTIRAFATDGALLYAATREGPLWEVRLDTLTKRDLGLGGWWSTIALAAGGGKVYAVTLAGKLWEIDPARGTKTIVQMAGWENAISLAVAR